MSHGGGSVLNIKRGSSSDRIVTRACKQARLLRSVPSFLRPVGHVSRYLLKTTPLDGRRLYLNLRASGRLTRCSGGTPGTRASRSIRPCVHGAPSSRRSTPLGRTRRRPLVGRGRFREGDESDAFCFCVPSVASQRACRLHGAL